MRLRILSDLHLEFGPPELPELDEDLVILAGDTAEGVAGLRWAAERWPRTPVAYVLGNHEYYHHDFQNLVEDLKAEARGSTVLVLERDCVTVGDVEVLGCTLWTDQNLWNNAATCGDFLAQRMNDYHQIRGPQPGQLLCPQDTLAAHQVTRAWLEERNQDPWHKRRVVVTHHAPTPLSIPAEEWQALGRYGHDSPAGLGLLTRAGYASRLDGLVKASGAALWVHGHIHAPADYRVGITRVLANPRGYARQLEGRFQPGLVVEV